MTLQAYFDGSYGPKFPNGTAAYGFIIKGDSVYAGYGRLGSGPGFSNNCAEYFGLYQAMLYVQEHFPYEQVTFYGDSTLVINQMNGVSKAKKGHYLPYYQQAIDLATPYIKKQQWSFEWVPRAMNSEADELSQYSRYKQ